MEMLRLASESADYEARGQIPKSFKALYVRK